MFIRATYDREKKTVHYFDDDENETLYIGGSFAWRTNNPGNVTKPTSYVMDGAIGYAQRTNTSKGLFVIFPDRATGSAAHQKVLKSVYGDSTVSGMITKYAPPSENDTAGYIDFVTKTSGVSSGDVVGSLPDDKFAAVTAAMERQEGWVPGVIKYLGKPVRVQLVDKLSQPFSNQKLSIKSDDKSFDTTSDEFGQLPWIYSGLLGNDISIYYMREKNDLESVGSFSAGSIASGYTFKAPYYLLNSQPRVHEADDRFRPSIHVVQSGETLSAIAAQYGVTVEAMVRANGLKDPDHVYARQHLRIPSGGSLDDSCGSQPSPIAMSQDASLHHGHTKGSTVQTDSAKGGKANQNGIHVTHQRNVDLHPLTLLSSGTLELSGRQWCGKFLQSVDLDDLIEPFKTNAKRFIGALRSAGISVRISTTYRPIERSYLMYHAAQIASGTEQADKVPVWTGENKINIDWAHRDRNGIPNLMRAKKAAQEMLDDFKIGDNPVAAPKNSNHNKKLAVDMRISNYIGKSAQDAHGDFVEIKSFGDLMAVGETYSVFHKLPKDPPHWSITGK